MFLLCIRMVRLMISVISYRRRVWSRPVLIRRRSQGYGGSTSSLRYSKWTDVILGLLCAHAHARLDLARAGDNEAKWMMKHAPKCVRTSDPVIRSPAHYLWTTAPTCPNQVYIIHVTILFMMMPGSINLVIPRWCLEALNMRYNKPSIYYSYML